MDLDEIKEILQTAFPDGDVLVKDLTGTKDHIRVEVESTVFAGKSLIDQHKMVQAPLNDQYMDGRIHALSIKTTTK